MEPHLVPDVDGLANQRSQTCLAQLSDRDLPLRQNGLKRSTMLWAAGVACMRLMSPRPP